MSIRTRPISFVVEQLAFLGRRLAAHDRDDRYYSRANAWTRPFVEKLTAELVTVDSILRGF